MLEGMAATGLPKDWRNALLLGRLDAGDGPLPVIVENGRVRDVSRSTPTVSEFLNTWSGATPAGEDLGPLDALPITLAFQGDPKLRLLAPCDLQCIKACGVTFAVSPVRTGHRRALGIAALMGNLARRGLLPVPQ
jgi:fumarylacetoacetate (FAA) hydrolase family protein